MQKGGIYGYWEHTMHGIVDLHHTSQITERMHERLPRVLQRQMVYWPCRPAIIMQSVATQNSHHLENRLHSDFCLFPCMPDALSDMNLLFLWCLVLQGICASCLWTF